MRKTSLIGVGFLVFCSLCTYAVGNPVSSDDDPVIAEVLGKKIRKSQAEDHMDLTSLIVGPHFEQYAKLHEIEATEPEIQAFLRATMPEDLGEDVSESDLKAEKSSIEEQLKSRTLTPSERQSLEEELELVNRVLAEGQDVVFKEMMEEQAKNVILYWKVNRALFRQYGGRIIFQQGGIEPIDAYLEFLKEHEKNGSFKIFDETEKRKFWDYFTNDSIHDFIDVTPEEAEKMLRDPWWLQKGP